MSHSSAIVEVISVCEILIYCRNDAHSIDSSMNHKESYLIENINMSITNDKIDVLQFHHLLGTRESIVLA